MTTSSKVVYKEYNAEDPVSILSVEQETISTDLQPGEVLIKVLLSPINPSDTSSLRGLYASRPPLPATPGGEGVAEVVKSTSDGFQPGDHVLTRKKFFGYWRQYGVVLDKELIKLPKELPIEAAATLIVNPCTAYLMIRKIVDLQPGDSLIQNAANSALGIIVIQQAKALGIKTINVIRNRPNLQELVDELKALGADAVITDEQLAQGLSSLNLGLPAPKLALECVGGQSAGALVSALANGGTMAVYGALAARTANIPQGDLIFRDIKVQGFWLTKWAMENKPEDFQKVIQEIVALYIGGKLKLPKFRKFPLAQVQDAVKMALQGFTNEKILLEMN